MAKNTLYDILQVAKNANESVVLAAYENLKNQYSAELNNGDADARSRLIFLNEAYAVIGSPERRRNYDLKEAQKEQGLSSPIESGIHSMSYREENVFLEWWNGSRTAVILGAVGILAIFFVAYKFIGQNREQKILERKVIHEAVKDIKIIEVQSTRANNEKILVEGAVQAQQSAMKNEEKLIDRSYEIANRSQDNQRQELEYRANAGSEILEMQRQRLEEEKKQMDWERRQVEVRRGEAQAREAVIRDKQRLCDLYISDRRYAEARAEGCGRIR